MSEESAREGDRKERLLLTRAEAAELLGMSLSHFQRHVMRELPKIRTGSMVQFTRADLEAWIELKREQDSAPAQPLTRTRRETAAKRKELVIDSKRRVKPRELVIDPKRLARLQRATQR